MNLSSLTSQILGNLVPSKSERAKLNNVILFVKNQLTLELKKQKTNAEIIVGGSTAKDTWLSGNHDIDFFVRFFGEKESEISKILKKALVKIFPKLTVLKGTREYYQAKYKNYKFEFVPVFKLDSPQEAKNSMDASPFHIEYVKKHTAKNPELANQIRILKSFVYCTGVYGAETYIAGFSGYTLELLMIHYKTFVNLVNQLDKISPPIFIDTEKHYPSLSKALRTLGTSKTKSPIILVDPVLKNRNAAAALGYPAFAKFIFAIRMFKRKPSRQFFETKKTCVSEIYRMSKKRGTLLVFEKPKRTKDKEDVYFSKLNSKIEKIAQKFKKAGLRIYNYGYLENPLVVYFEFETIKLSEYKKHMGPPVWIGSQYFDEFVRKWKSSYVLETNLVVDVPREFSNITFYVHKILKGELKNV